MGATLVDGIRAQCAVEPVAFVSCSEHREEDGGEDLKWTSSFGPKARWLKVEPAPNPRSSKNTSSCSSSRGKRLRPSSATTTLPAPSRGD